MAPKLETQTTAAMSFYFQSHSSLEYIISKNAIKLSSMLPVGTQFQADFGTTIRSA